MYVTRGCVSILERGPSHRLVSSSDAAIPRGHISNIGFDSCSISVFQATPVIRREVMDIHPAIIPSARTWPDSRRSDSCRTARGRTEVVSRGRPISCKKRRRHLQGERGRSLPVTIADVH